MKSTFIFSLLVAVLSALLVYFIPSELNPVVWDDPSPLLELKDSLSPNNLLTNSEKLGLNEFSGPESIAFDASTGEGFSGLGDGTVVQFSESGRLIKSIFFSGGFLQTKSENGISEETFKLQTWCKTESLEKRLSWDVEGEAKCGRPLGLRFKNVKSGHKLLYIMDAYHGLFELDLKTLVAKHIISINTTIQIPHYPHDPSILLKPKFYNDFDITNNNVVLFTDTSYKYTRSQNRVELFDAAPRGRLFSYDLNKHELKVLLCGLHFPNGVQLFESKKNNEVIVAELTRFRVLKVDISAPFVSGDYSLQFNNSNDQNTAHHSLTSCSEHGSLYKLFQEEKKAKQNNKFKHNEKIGVEIFSDSIPGFPDNIRADTVTERGKTYYLIGIGSKSSKPFSFTWFAYQSKLLRIVLCKLIPWKWSEHLVPSYGLIVVLDNKGTIVSSLHDPTGKSKMISEAHKNPKTKDLWFGSHSNNYIGIVKKDDLPDKW